MSGFHDPATGSGHNHPAFFGHSSAKRFGSGIAGILTLRSSRTENRNLSIHPKRSKDFEGVPQFLQGSAEDLQVTSSCFVLGQLIRRLFDLSNQLFVMLQL